MGQPAQLPQSHTADLPCFFFLTMLMMIAATIAMSTAHMMIVPMFDDIHWSISSSPLVSGQIGSFPSEYAHFVFTFSVVLYGLNTMNSIPAIRRTETISPTTFSSPVKAPPIWFTHRATAYAKPHS